MADRPYWGPLSGFWYANVKRKRKEKREVLPLACLARHARPLVTPQNAAYAGHRQKITVILIHHLSLRISSSLSQHPGPNNHLTIM